MLKEITNQKTWSEHISKASPNTFLHSWHWGNVQQSTGEGVRRLGIYKNDSLVAIAQLVIVNAKRGRHYLIPHGPIISNEYPVTDCLSQIINYAKKHAAQDKCIALRVAPLITNTAINRRLFSELGFRPAPLHVHTELTWIVDISIPEDQILSHMRKTSRHAIRNASKNGVQTQIITNPNEALNRFWPLYQQTTNRHGFVPFSRSFLETQLNEFSSDSSVFTVIATYDNKDTAAGIFINTNDKVFYHHGSSLKLSSNISPAHAVQWAAIKEAKMRGAKQLNMWGIAPQDQPNHPFAGITVFKRGFGGKEIDYMHAQDFPLGTGYWKLWLVDSYRKFRRGF